MRRHLRRYGWIYAMLAFALLFPVFVWHSRQLPPSDPASVQLLVEWFESELEARYGPPRWDDFAAMYRGGVPENGGSFSALTHRSSVNEMLKAGRLLAATAALLDDVEGKTREVLDRWDALVGTGRFEQSRQDVLALAQSNPPKPAPLVPNFLDVQIQVRLRVALALRDVAREDWDRALVELRNAAHAVDPMRGGELIGVLIAVAGRGMAYGGYDALLSQDPPAEVCRRALDDLVAMRDTEPEVTPLVYLNESLASIAMTLPDSPYRYRKGPVDVQLGKMMGISYAAAFAAQGSDSLYAAERLRPMTALMRESDYSWTMLKTLALDWTAPPAMKSWLRETAEEHPELLDLPGVPEEVEAKMEFWTRAYAAGIMRQREAMLGIQVDIRADVGATIGHLVALGFAARLYELEHGTPPERIEQLVPAYLPPDLREGVMRPVRMGRVYVDDTLRAALWERYLPDAALHEPYHSRPVAGGTGPVREWTLDGVAGLGDAVRGQRVALAFAMGQSMRRYPQLVESVQFDVQWRHGEWEPFTRLPDDPQAVALRYRAVLRAPEEVLAFWSAGPDGDDDGGQIPYEPTNGIKSNGDIMQFMLK